LRIYKLGFGTPSTAPHIYIHSHVDTVYVTRGDMRLDAGYEEDDLIQ
jgi:hypothetical protein